jgi:hypothetical protein
MWDYFTHRYKFSLENVMRTLAILALIAKDEALGERSELAERAERAELANQTNQSAMSPTRRRLYFATRILDEVRSQMSELLESLRELNLSLIFTEMPSPRSKRDAVYVRLMTPRGTTTLAETHVYCAGFQLSRLSPRKQEALNRDYLHTLFMLHESSARGTRTPLARERYAILLRQALEQSKDTVTALADFALAFSTAYQKTARMTVADDSDVYYRQAARLGAAELRLRLVYSLIVQG